jgi:virginiamycin B lyase
MKWKGRAKMKSLKVWIAVAFLAGLFVLVGGTAPLQASSDGYIYWANYFNNSIGRANLDGSDANAQFIPDLYGPCGLAVNEKYLYWTYFSFYQGTSIGRANLDGTDINPNFISGCTNPWGLAIDDDYIYWTNIEPLNEIGRAKLDGSEPNQSFIKLNLGGAPRGVTVSKDFIYWTNYNTCTIGRANLDGTGVNENWITYPTVNPHCIAITETYIYWSNYDNGTIARANLDGTGAEIWKVGLQMPLGIEAKGDYIYWGEFGSGRLGRSNLDGSGFNPDWITGIGSSCMIALTQDRVKYTFEGFASPIENPPTINKANAGQAIPVKWRITDRDGIPILDPASFVSLKSYIVNCADFEGDPINSVDELAAGSSGLQYLGDGWWQFNWKTPKTYKGQCRTMILTLGDHSEHAANFSFK